jgi:hypothetical protein
MSQEAPSNTGSSLSRVPSEARYGVLLLGWTAATVATVLGLLLLVLWGMTAGGMELFTIPAGTTELQLGSASGVLMIGVFETRNPGWWRARSTLSLYDVHPDSDRSILGFTFVGGLHGWAIGVPHLFVAAALMIVPAWWLLIVRNRHAVEERRALGLCRHCGYDLRESPELCPECGETAHRAPSLDASPPLVS